MEQLTYTSESWWDQYKSKASKVIAGLSVIALTACSINGGDAPSSTERSSAATPTSESPTPTVEVDPKDNMEPTEELQLICPPTDKSPECN